MTVIKSRIIGLQTMNGAGTRSGWCPTTPRWRRRGGRRGCWCSGTTTRATERARASACWWPTWQSSRGRWRSTAATRWSRWGEFHNFDIDIFGKPNCCVFTISSSAPWPAPVPGGSLHGRADRASGQPGARHAAAGGARAHGPPRQARPSLRLPPPDLPRQGGQQDPAQGGDWRPRHRPRHQLPGGWSFSKLN